MVNVSVRVTDSVDITNITSIPLLIDVTVFHTDEVPGCIKWRTADKLSRLIEDGNREQSNDTTQRKANFMGIHINDISGRYVCNILHTHQASQ